MFTWMGRWGWAITTKAIVKCELYGARIAQWVDRPTEKPGVILTRFRVPVTARDFF